MSIRHATAADLPAIIAIYNAAIPGRLATADTDAVTVASREHWFATHAPETYPLWVDETAGALTGWLSFSAFYGRPAYRATAELSVYVAPSAQRRGVARGLVARALEHAPRLGLTTLLGFVFGHNAPSLALFADSGFERWGALPRVAVLDGIARDLVILGRRVAGAAC